MKTASSARPLKSCLSKSVPEYLHHSPRHSRFAPPLRLTPTLGKTLAALACLWLSSIPRAACADDATTNTTTVREMVSQGALMNLQTGKTLKLPLPANAKYSVEGVDGLVKAQAQDQILSVTALRAGRAILIIQVPGVQPQRYLLRIDGAGEEIVLPSTPVTILTPAESEALGATSFAADSIGQDSTFAARVALPASLPGALQTEPMRLASWQLTRPGALEVAPRAQKTFSLHTSLAQARATEAEAASHISLISASSPAAKIERLALENRSAQITISANAQVAPPLPNLEVLPRTGSKSTVPPAGFPALGTPAVSPIKSVAAAPPEMSALSTNSATVKSATPTPAVATPGANGGTGDSASSDVTTTSDVPPPRISGNAPFPMESALPADVARMASDPTAKRPLYRVTSGMARIMAFHANILAVFFSDENIMDARAINARTLAVTGKGPGKSTLAVFLSRYEGDVVGRAVIYNIEVFPTSGRAIAPAFTDPTAAESAIRTAINDPRVRVSVIQRPDGTLVAQLAGGLRDKAEVDAAVTTASLFVPNVIPSLYVDAKAPSLEEALRGPDLIGQPLLQSQLRSIFGNDTIELISLPGGTALKATVDSPSEAEALLSILPSLGRQVQPFIVLRGTEGNRIYTSEHPILYGEDYEITRRLNEVTGISTVYAVRTARNALAVYGTVRNRAEYETVRRYANILPQLQESVTTTQQTTTQNGGGLTLPIATTATSTSVAALAPALSAAAGLAPAPATTPLTGRAAANSPSSGHMFPTQIQMFVRVLDDSASSVRLVTVESSVVEINRNAVKGLGAQFGSATLISSVTDTGGTNTTVGSDFNLGQGLVGDFGGTGTFKNINPLRVTLSALLQNKTARLLSRPNLTAVEGASAQITIGGVRPVPQVTSTGAAGGSQQTNIVFRRFGIILSMRPTVTDDDTIILQIRADVTNLDPTIAVTINGAVIPGESVRSVDTTVTIHEGDTLVLGGLITNDMRKQTTKVPILGDIPILGSLFRSKNFENNETELAIFMTPHIQRQHISPNGQNAVSMIPSFPALPSSQDDQQQSPLGLVNAGTSTQ